MVLCLWGELVVVFVFVFVFAVAFVAVVEVVVVWVVFVFVHAVVRGMVNILLQVAEVKEDGKQDDRSHSEKTMPQRIC